MSNERTFSIIKPNAMAKNALGGIIQKLEEAGLKVAAAKTVRMTLDQCEEFYAEHKGRPFFSDLVTFMTSGPVLLMCLAGDNAIEVNRKVMGSTDPKEAAPGTIRHEFGDSVGENAIHGSDSVQSAQRELKLFFKDEEIFS